MKVTIKNGRIFYDTNDYYHRLIGGYGALSTVVTFFPQGVQGWLLLFVATVVLSIIVTLFNMSTLHTELVTEGAMNYALFMPHVIVLILYFYLLWIITCKRNASVVKQTIVILWVVGPISIALLMAFFNTSFVTFYCQSELLVLMVLRRWTVTLS